MENQYGFEKMTACEERVLELTVKGMKNKEISECLNISIHTVKSQICSILHKTGMRDRKQLIFELSNYFGQKNSQ